MVSKRTFAGGRVALYHGDALHLYARWPRPVVIVSDGPYGIEPWDGGATAGTTLAAWYEPHAAAWAAAASAETTLWFWSTEVGWAEVHPVLVRHGWVYRQLCVWDKGLTHAAKNSNTRTLRKLPTVTEVCGHCVRPVEWAADGGCGGAGWSAQAWLRAEWDRTGLPLRDANRACGVKNVASRRYLIRDHRWSRPPGTAVARLAAYANEHGDPAGRPYFVTPGGERPVNAAEWDCPGSAAGGAWARRRAKFFCAAGLTNVWRARPVRGAMRVRVGGAGPVASQKPLELMERVIRLSSEPGDVVWEPFGGVFTAAVAAHRLGRRCFSAEVVKLCFETGVRRFRYDAARTSGSR